MLVLKSAEKEISFPEKTPIHMCWDYRNESASKTFNYKLSIYIDANDYIQDLIKSTWGIPELPELILEIKDADSSQIILKGKSSKYIPCSHITCNW
jgi:hypothetical protein